VYFCQNKGGEKGREIIHFENKKLDVVGFENFKKKDFFAQKVERLCFFTLVDVGFIFLFPVGFLAFRQWICYETFESLENF